MSSSIQVALSPTRHGNETAVSCAKALEVPVEASAGGPSPQDVKDLPEMEVDDDADHGSPLRMRAVLRTLFSGDEPVGSSTKNLKIECDLQSVPELIDNSGDTRRNDMPSGRENICSAVTDQNIQTEVVQKMGKEESSTPKNERAADEELGSLVLDDPRWSTCQRVKATDHDIQTQEEEIAKETSVHMVKSAVTDIDEGKNSFSQDRTSPAVATESITKPLKNSTPFKFSGLNHVALCCGNLERTLEFYCGLLGLIMSPDRPNLPYRGAWLLLGAEGIHIMEVPNPDPVSGRPHHGGWDRHVCLNCTNVESLQKVLDKAGIPYQTSIVPSIFCRDPDGNGLEFIEMS